MSKKNIKDVVKESQEFDYLKEQEKSRKNPNLALRNALEKSGVLKKFSNLTPIKK
jgi:hypothetical protein